MAIPTVLETINQRKLEEIAERKKNTPQDKLREFAEDVSLRQYRGFERALIEKISSGEPAVIAEIKKASPSKGVIREDFEPNKIAIAYESAGAACLSILTDRDFFQGSEEYLIAGRNACALPVIRKDFIIDPYQVYEASYIGADAILLIVASLSKNQLNELNSLATSIGLDVLIEVHDRNELEIALETNNKLIGINNRNLHTFDTNLDTTLELMDSVPKDRLIITESGIHARSDVRRMLDAGIGSFLVGESFMRFDNPGEGLRQLFF